MEITITRGGGFAPWQEQLGPVDTASLGYVGARIKTKVANVGFFDLPEELSGEPDNRPWRRFTVADGERQHSVRFTAGTNTPEVEALRALESILLGAGARFEPADSLAETGPGKHQTFGWAAWYNRMPGITDPDLHVVGTVRLRSSSATVSLELGDPGVVPEPGVAVLQLTIEYPEGGGTDDIDDREVSWRGDVGPDIERVRVIGDAEVEIDEVTIAT